MTGWLVDIQLKVLIVEQDATTCFEDGHMVLILLREHVAVVTLRQGSFHFDHLTLELRTSHGVRVTPVSLRKEMPPLQSVRWRRVLSLPFDLAFGVSPAFWDHWSEGSHEPQRSLESQEGKCRPVGEGPWPRTWLSLHSFEAGPVHRFQVFDRRTIREDRKVFFSARTRKR